MSQPATKRGLSKRLIAVSAAAVLLIGGVTAATVASGGGEDAARADRPAAAAAPNAAPSDPAERGDAGGLQDPAAAVSEASVTDAIATRVQIPKIDVDSTLEQLPLDPNTGELTPPVEWLSAGWYKDGTVPGDRGPAVIAGHVDSITAPAVFSRLGELAPGDQILVTLSNGEVREFTVDSQLTTPKDEFPTAQVYGPTPNAQLRLITCDGAFDNSTGHYVDNLVINAHLV